jgi:hypothetical protein
MLIVRPSKKKLKCEILSTAGKSPSGRIGHSMTFNEPINCIVIHGGKNELDKEFYLNDTYLLDL